MIPLAPSSDRAKRWFPQELTGQTRYSEAMNQGSNHARGRFTAANLGIGARAPAI